MKKILILIHAFIFIIFISSCNNKKEDEIKKDECDHTYSYSLNDDYSKIISNCDNCDYSYEINPFFSFKFNYGYFDLDRYLIKENAKKFYLEIYVEIFNFINAKKDIKPTIKNNNSYYEIITIDYSKFSLTKEEAMAIWHLVSLDNLEFYFLEKTVLTSTKELIILCDELYAKYEQRIIVDDKINELKNIVNSFENNKKLESIYDYVINNMKYAYDYIDGEKVAKNTFDSYEISGALLNKEGVCEAYCKMFGYMLKCANIKSIMYLGNGIMLSGDSVRHSWTLVEVDDLYYGFDLTWDDSNSNNANYGLSYDNLLKRHKEIEFASSSLNYGIDYIYKMPKMATKNLIINQQIGA